MRASTTGRNKAQQRTTPTPSRLEPTTYTRPDGKPHGFRWFAEEQEQLKKLAPDGTIGGGAAALHWSLPPELDAGGRCFTKGMRDALAAAVRAGRLPPPHPARQAASAPDELAELRARRREQQPRLYDRVRDLMLSVEDYTPPEVPAAAPPALVSREVARHQLGRLERLLLQARPPRLYQRVRELMLTVEDYAPPAAPAESPAPVPREVARHQLGRLERLLLQAGGAPRRPRRPRPRAWSTP